MWETIIIRSALFIVCWGVLSLLTVNVIERIDNNKKKKN